MNDKLKPGDVEGFMMAIHPDAVPPEFVADAAPLFLQLRIPPDVAVKRMRDILRDAFDAHGWVETTWVKADDRLRESQGWQPAEHWNEPENRRAHIDATVARWCT